MTNQAQREAEQYVQRSLKTQERLGYSARVDKDVYEDAVKATARAVDSLLRVQRRSRQLHN